MNLAITNRFIREATWACLACMLGIVSFVVMFIWAMQMMGPQLMEFLSSIDFLRQMLELAFGISLTGNVSSNVLYSISCLHPVVLALAWGVLISIATRQTAGEVERGTAELLLTLPLSRRRLLNSGVACWVLAAVAVSVAPMIGLLIGTRLFEPHEPIQYIRFVMVMFNFLALNLTVAAIATLLGVCIPRRGIAVAITSAILITGLAMNFLESFLPFIERLRFLNLLNYYRPGNIVRDGVWPIGNMLILAGLALASLLVTQAVWQRRDIPSP